MYDDFDTMRQIDEYFWYAYDEIYHNDWMTEEEIPEEHDDYVRSCYMI